MRKGGLSGCRKHVRIAEHFFDNGYSRFSGDNQERILQIYSGLLTEAGRCAKNFAENSCLDAFRKSGIGTTNR